MAEIVKIGKVGKKHDLYPPKEIREALGLKKGQKVVYSLEEGELTVKPITSIEGVENMEKFAETTVKEFEEFTKELVRETLEED